MPKFILVVPSAPVAGSEDDYNRWYDEEHLGDVCAVPGFVASTRYTAVAASPDAPPAPYLAIYEIDADDAEAAIAELQRRAGTGEMHISPALDIASTRMWLYRVR